ncbi:hypothetical protein B0H21DRAFT_712418 [Amylocystis lapponica]|nr:hypothetical protein B0H21DRAFT_712418 [Amylocystis lapponica]
MSTLSSAENARFSRVPSSSSLPSLSICSTLGTSSTDPSPLSSALCTPGEARSEFLDTVVIRVDPPAEDGVPPHRFDLDMIEPTDDAPPLKPKPLARVVAKAKQIAEKTLSVRRAFRKGNHKTRERNPATLGASLSLNMISSVPGSWPDDDPRGYSAALSVKIRQEVVSHAALAEEAAEQPKPSVRGAEPLQLERPDTDLEIAEEDEDDFESLSSAAPESLYGALKSLHDSLRAALAARQPLTARNIALIFLRVICFLPWCAAVGGAILLSPQHLEGVAFGPGYIASPRGTARFAHWAEFAVHHVCIFLASLVAILCWNTVHGALVLGATLARFAWVWCDFRVKDGIPLGEDDRQSVYLAAALAYMSEDDAVLCLRNGLGDVRDAQVPGGQ